MKATVTCLAALAAVALPAQGFAKEPLPLAPSSHWNLSYDSEACRLSRSFGEGDRQVLLAFTKYAPGTGIEVLVSGIPLKSNGTTSFAYSFDPQRRTNVPRPLFGDTETGGTMWQFATGLIPSKDYERLRDDDSNRAAFDAAEREAAAEIESFSILRGVTQPVQLETGNLSGAMEAMDTCLDDLVASWGFDPAEQSTLASEPKPVTSPNRWINWRDYPDKALEKDFAGAVRFRLRIGDDGRVQSCTIQSSYSDPSFPEVVCEALSRRARFEPAQRPDGTAVSSYWSNTVLFLPHG